MVTVERRDVRECYVPSLEVGKRMDRRVLQHNDLPGADIIFGAREYPVAARLVFLDEVVVRVQEVQCTVSDHRGVLRTGVGDFQLQRHPAALGDVAQDRIPELRRQGGAAPDDDAERVRLILGPALGPKDKEQHDDE